MTTPATDNQTPANLTEDQLNALRNLTAAVHYQLRVEEDAVETQRAELERQLTELREQQKKADRILSHLDKLLAPASSRRRGRDSSKPATRTKRRTSEGGREQKER